MTPDDKREVRITHGLLALCLIGISWLIVATERIDASNQRLMAVTRDPISDRWYDHDGVEHIITTSPLPGESSEEHYARHAERSRKLRVAYPVFIR